jgi:hypothetical protein
MAHQASTRIEDLPDNVDQDISSKILKELNEDNESISSEIIVKPSNKSNIDSDDYISKILECLKSQKETLIVFVVVFILSNKTFIELISKVKYISSMPAHGLGYNAIISIVASIIFFVLKFILDKALK